MRIQLWIACLVGLALVYGEALAAGEDESEMLPPDGTYSFPTYEPVVPRGFVGPIPLFSSPVPACAFSWNTFAANRNLVGPVTFEPTPTFTCHNFDQDGDNIRDPNTGGTGGTAKLVCPEGQARSDDLSLCAIEDIVTQSCEVGDLNGPPLVSTPPNVTPVPGAGPSTNNPIQVVSGVKIERFVDFSTADEKLQLVRLYTSRPFRASSMGWGWRTNFDRNLVVTRRTAAIQLGNFETIRFVRNTDDEFSAARQIGRSFSSGGRLDVVHRLVRLDDGGLQLTFPDGRRERYSEDLVLQEIVRLGGYTQTLRYDAEGNLVEVSDSFDRSIVFTHNDIGLVTSSTGPDGRAYLYEYQPTFNTAGLQREGNREMLRQFQVLARVFVPDATATRADDRFIRYHYEEENRPYLITGITDERGIRVKTTRYEAGRAVSSGAPDGDRVMTVAGPFVSALRRTNRRFEVTNPLGAVFDHDYLPSRAGLVPNVVSLRADGETVEAATTSETVRDGFVVEKTDQLGFRTLIERDISNGRPTELTFLAGTPNEYSVSVSYHNVFPLPTRIVEPSSISTFVYDPDGNLTSSLVIDTTTHTTPYETNGQRRRIQYSYLPGGLLASVDGALPGGSDTLSFSYTDEGFLSTITDANGLITTIAAHNGRGQPLSIVAPNGLVSEIRYNERGWPVRFTVNPGSRARVTEVAYDPAGNVQRMRAPSGGSLDFSYDENNWVTSVSNSFGETISFKRDAMGNVLTRTVSDSRGNTRFTASSEFDLIGRLLRSVDAIGNATSYAYDRRNQLVGVVDPIGNVWNWSFDGLGRAISAVEPDGDDVTLNYEPAGNPVGFSDGRNLETRYVYNGFGEVIQETSPDRGVRVFEYDQAGQLIRMTTADGDVEQYTYDLGGRLLTRSFPNDPDMNQRFIYDRTTRVSAGRGALTRVEDQHGRIDYTYNLFGEVTSERRVLGGQRYLTRYTYTNLGLVNIITYPSGLRVRHRYDRIGRLTMVEARLPGGRWVPVAGGLSWEPFGPLTGYTSHNGLQNTRSVDASYRLTGFNVVSGPRRLLDKTITREGLGRVSQITDRLDTRRSAAYSYTDDGRLSRAVGFWGDRSWRYDAVGNRTRQVTRNEDGSRDRINYDYATDSNQIIQERNGVGEVTRTFTHRVGGDISRDRRIGNSNFRYAYDAAGRLSEVRRGRRVEASYGYDAFGRRILRDVRGGMSSHFLYAASGRPLAEHEAGTGDVFREYIWLNDILIAMAQGDELFAVHGGHLGQPVLATDATGGIVWDAEFSPYGGVLPFASSTDAEIDLRFPGQWADGENGLFQNWHRDYDPSLGRYIQADPLGLVAGQSLYGYVGGDPVNFVDPTGLEGSSANMTAQERGAEQRRRAAGLTGLFAAVDMGMVAEAPFSGAMNQLNPDVPVTPMTDADVAMIGFNLPTGLTGTSSSLFGQLRDEIICRLPEPIQNVLAARSAVRKAANAADNIASNRLGLPPIDVNRTIQMNVDEFSTSMSIEQRQQRRPRERRNTLIGVNQ